MGPVGLIVVAGLRHLLEHLTPWLDHFDREQLLFVASETLYWITTYAGVAIFAGLTAYDMQKIKGYAQASQGGEAEQRASILGALALYLDFINLFLYLLRIFGRSR